MLTWTPWLASGPSDCFHSALSSLSVPTDSSGTSFCAAKGRPHASARAVAVLAIVPGGRRTAKGEIEERLRGPTAARQLRDSTQRGCTDAVALVALHTGDHHASCNEGFIVVGIRFEFVWHRLCAGCGHKWWWGRWCRPGRHRNGNAECKRNDGVTVWRVRRKHDGEVGRHVTKADEA